MKKHTQIQILLYEYLRNELPQDQRQRVERHVAECTICSRELEELREVAALTFDQSLNPAEALPSEYWEGFAVSVEERLRVHQTNASQFSDAVREFFNSLLFPRYRPIAATGVALAVVVALMLFEKKNESNNIQSRDKRLAEQVTERPIEVIPSSERMGQYFRKTKMLLIGFTNMKVDEDQPMDLSVERKVSRELVHEARYLKQQPHDVRTARLMGDLEKILIELANMKEKNDLPNVEIIRGGIHQENLLFKIRMAEALYDSTRFLQTKQSY